MAVQRAEQTPAAARAAARASRADGERRRAARAAAIANSTTPNTAFTVSSQRPLLESATANWVLRHCDPRLTTMTYGHGLRITDI